MSTTLTHPVNGTWIVFEEGDKHDDIEEMQLPYEPLRTLGQGGYSVVEEVRDHRTSLVYARKLYLLRRDNKRRLKECFSNELNIINSLRQHQHMIRLFATYTTKDRLGLILTPVADGGDLEAFLDNLATCRQNPIDNRIRIKAMEECLEQGFGCLADGLAFMRENRVRHKDIKAHNILVHRGRLLYTDFGLSLDYRALDDSITVGPTAMTKRYAAPEVIKGQSKDSSSDVFSLGCVFFEMLMALSNDRFLEETRASSESRPLFSELMPDLHAHLYAAKFDPRIMFLSENIISMTHPHPQDRPSASSVAKSILSHPGFSCMQCRAVVPSTEKRLTLSPSEDSASGTSGRFLIQKGHDYIIKDVNQLPYEVISLLGSGSFTSVDMIKDKNTGSVYARKVILIPTRTRRSMLEQVFLDEARNLRALDGHHHMMSLLATYVAPRMCGLVLEPVASEGDLDDYLSTYLEICQDHSSIERASHMTMVIERAFGCIAGALAWMHDRRIRHKNVTPRKILIHEDAIILNISFEMKNYSDLSRATTEGPSHAGLMRRYSAPEVLAEQPRGASADIYSLGCVFLAMAEAVMGSFTIDYRATFSEQMDALMEQFGGSFSRGLQRYHFLYPIVLSMTQEDRNKRPSAIEIAAQFKPRHDFSCAKCRAEP